MKIIEFDKKVVKVCFVFSAYIINELFSADALLLGFKHDGSAMGVVGANIAVATDINVFQTVIKVGANGLRKKRLL